MKWLTNIFRSKKQSERKIDYFQITSDWNADPVSPEVQLEINGDHLIMEILVNHLVFDDFEEGDKAKIIFQYCSIYSLNHCNDEGYYYGQYRTNPNELPWGEFYEIKRGLDRKFPDPITIVNKETEGKRHYVFFFKDETFECLADDFALELLDKQGNRKRLNYSYKLRPAYNSSEQLIEFVKIGDADRFIEKLLELLSKNGFSFDDMTDVWMNDEVWIHLKSINGKTTITKDIWDMIFILGEQNQIDIQKINQILIDSGEFKKIEVNPEDYKIKENESTTMAKKS
ncbi:hypothetical protein [Cyclobacterium qasimii]|uniref:Uncharacterized protein n=2 Tax=Cyclobacterium qasimii TaxID=1350429 RepID=S7X5E4_9BACT|nr:hypothetical protein [Cyclobacterium qasimii]EPR71293.1 hypothetical protein ADICYQ_0519 [Cyclobacterium qasimii M12-11B]GEO23802.1 hypothetical protein CQA01_43360 [Cyclobacterium qasimii]